jgi:hypothetical protein
MIFILFFTFIHIVFISKESSSFYQRFRVNKYELSITCYIRDFCHRQVINYFLRILHVNLNFDGRGINFWTI